MVTGGAGFIGSHLVERLMERGNRVIVYDNFDEYYSGKEENLCNASGHPDFALVRADILDFETLRETLRGVDVVFHLAAQPGVRFSLNNPQKTNSVNTAGTINVLEAAKRAGVKRLVFSSSSSVYGTPLYMPVDEEHPNNPLSIYGGSKLAAEKYCRIYNDFLGLDSVILRYHTVYGPRQRPDMALHKWASLLSMGKSPTIYGDGRQTRDFTYVDDIVEGTLRAAEVEAIGGEIFNLGCGSRVSINEAVMMLMGSMGLEDVEPVYEPPKQGDAPDTHADIRKACRVLGYKPQVALDEGIERFVKWFKSR